MNFVARVMDELSAYCYAAAASVAAAFGGPLVSSTAALAGKASTIDSYSLFLIS